MTADEQAVLTALREQQQELSGLLAGLDDDGWQRPSPCEGWSVTDVVLHLAQTNEMAIASARGHLEATLAELTDGVGPAGTVDEGAALMVERDRELGPGAIHARWLEGVDELNRVLTVADPHARVTWVAGQLSVRTLTTTRLAETWIHTTDVATALGHPLPSSDRLRHIARLAWRTLPYAFDLAGRALHGPVAFELVGPAGEPWDFIPDEAARTTIRGDGFELCTVAARRVDPRDTGLTGTGPDVDAVLELVRTYA
jgi:uncharacterized protein (TIGR03084 family)